MHVLAINGSPRKKWNTATLLQQALDGAASAGATTELVHLYDLTYRGCASCFECKKIGGKNYGRCAVKDGLTPVLERALAADVLLLGSPIYFGSESGEMRSCMERLLFPVTTYTAGYVSIAPRRIATALVYTMNIAEENVPVFHYDKLFGRMQSTLARIFGSCELLLATDTLQFNDYAKYLSTVWDAAAKAKRREEVFPRDCAKARELGARLVRAQGADRPNGAL